MGISIICNPKNDYYLNNNNLFFIMNTSSTFNIETRQTLFDIPKTLQRYVFISILKTIPQKKIIIIVYFFVFKDQNFGVYVFVIIK